MVQDDKEIKGKGLSGIDGGLEMYTVPMEMPKFCNKCPFGYCNYGFPLGSSCISTVDGEENKAGTYGYVCNVEFEENGRYTKVMRAEIDENITKPKWCGLKELENQNEG